MSDRTLQMSQALRGWEEENPWKSLALGFVPVAGQVYGAASAAAALRDPEASALDKSLAGASVTPLGALAKTAKKIIGGPVLAERAKKLGIEIPDWAKADDGRFYYPDPNLSDEGIDNMQRGNNLLSPSPDNEYEDPEVYLRTLFSDSPKTDLYNKLAPEMGGTRVRFDHYGPASWGGVDSTGKHMVVGGDDDMTNVPGTRQWHEQMQEYSDTIPHEMQHVMQKRIEKYPGGPKGRTGTNEKDAGSVSAYYNNPGEKEARLNSAYYRGEIPEGFPLQKAIDRQNMYTEMLRFGKTFDQNDEIKYILEGPQ